MSAGTWSIEALQVLSLFRFGRAMHGYAVCKATSLQPGTAYRILDRLERRGLLIGEQERVAPNLSGGRVPMVVYRGTTIADDHLATIRALVST